MARNPSQNHPKKSWFFFGYISFYSTLLLVSCDIKLQSHLTFFYQNSRQCRRTNGRPAHDILFFFPPISFVFLLSSIRYEIIEKLIRFAVSFIGKKNIVRFWHDNHWQHHYCRECCENEMLWNLFFHIKMIRKVFLIIRHPYNVRCIERVLCSPHITKSNSSTPIKTLTNSFYS